MAALGRIRSRLRATFSREPADGEFEKEVEAHLSLLTEKYMAEGMSEADARCAAMRQFGNVTSLAETRTEMLTFAPLAAFFRDLRFGARLLLKTPAWTLVAVLTLTVGIGANVAIFSLLRPVLFRALPYPNAARLVVPATIFTRYKSDRGSVSYADLLDWRARREIFEAVSAYSSSLADITEGEQPERVPALLVEDDYFRVLGMRPLLGRFFAREDNLPAAPPAAVLTYRFWMRRFGGDQSVIGRRIGVQGVPCKVLGVAAPNSTWPEEAEILLPLGTGGPPTADMLRRDNHIYGAIALLSPGVSTGQAQAKLTVMGAEVAQRETNRAGTNWKLHSLAAYSVGPGVRRTLAIVFGAAVLVLLIACVNVANLLLARGAVREREVAVRVALGAGRGRIAGQFLSESVVLAIAGALGGLAAGYLGLRALVRLAPPEIPHLEQAQMNLTVLAFAAGLCVITAILAGLVPAQQAGRLAPARSFHEMGRGAAGGLRTSRIRSVLVVSELALSIVLLAGAGLLIRSFGRLVQVEPGFLPNNVVTMQISVPAARYPGAAQVADGFERITDAVRRVPGVVAAAGTSSLPLGGGGFYLGRVFLREGQPEPPVSADTPGAWSVVQPGYFETMGIPIVEGRSFTEYDGAKSTPVIIISRSMAREMFPNSSPLGRRIRSWRDENVYREIVGVAADVRYYGLTADITNNVYVPHLQDTWRSIVLVVRTAGDPAARVRPIREAIWKIDRKLPVSEVRTLEQVVDQNLARTRFSMFLLAIFGAAAIILAAAGIYGLIAYVVAQRSREIGIRMALGAARTQVLSMVASGALRLAGAGVLLGLAGASALTRLMKSLLFEVSPTDARTLAAASAVLLAATIAAAFIPSWRATRVDPVETLRCE